MSHITKDCLERPRAKGAKFTNKNIAADDKVQDLNLVSWDAKRDRWNGFEAKDYEKVVDRYEKLEAIRKDMKQKEQVQLLYGKKTGESGGEEGGKEGQEGVQGDEMDDEAKIQDEDMEGGFT